MIPILMYHQVAKVPREQDPLGLAVPPDQFEQQMRYLVCNKYRCLSLPEAVQQLRIGGHATGRSFVLTFDDGYQDLYTIACPILEKYGFTATIFLVAGCLGTHSNWWVQEGERSNIMLSQAEARDLARKGYILGSHTISHPFLRRLDNQSAYDEIWNSKVLLQENLDIQVDYFSYPYSDTDVRIEGLVESAGYSAACAGDRGHWSIFHLWRVPCLRDDTTRSFALKASGLYNKLITLRESTPGRLFRRSVRTFRRQLADRHPRRPDILNQSLGVKPDREL